jgi:hypothetical protein
MTKEVEYIKYAAALFDLATRAANNQDKGRLLAMSEAWLNLADKVSRLARWRRVTERLVQEAFRESRPDGE